MTVNFGIDLGTTNSVVARYSQGGIEVFKNPVGHKETLPSVVAFRQGRILVGDKAREYQEKDPRNVVGSFKRKMGTSESFWIESLQETRSPIELSALVLAELKNFVYTGELLDAVVITIPAAFDTVQSNATKKAGHAAGFQEVYLLQEPIAASLAYANKEGKEGPQQQQWLVYDLGGGTFDVALVRTEHGEMRIVDHQGDNFLGGMDFDHLMLEKIVIPYLQTRADFGDLESALRSNTGRYNSLYYILLKKAEEVKVTLSAHVAAEMEFEIETPGGEHLDIYLTITRAQFEDIIDHKIAETVAMMRTILSRNNLEPSAVDCVLMVGGSTYIPSVRHKVEQALGISISTAVDPTTAVAAGAAYFAGTRKRATTPGEQTEIVKQTAEIAVATAYAKVSQDTEEYFLVNVKGDFSKLFYRIIRADGGYDSGLKAVKESFSEYLPLVANMNNSFELRIADAQNATVYQDNTVQIVSGKYGILGQPLPNDICLEIDDVENNTTKLEVVFEKNALLPMKRTLTKALTKTLRKGFDDRLVINILEGPSSASPLTNLPIGSIEIKGSDLKVDLVKGSDVEIVLEMSESRDLRITTYLMMTDQEFTNLFSPSERHVNLRKLEDDMFNLRQEVMKEMRDADAREDYETSRLLLGIAGSLQELLSQSRTLPADDVTDAKYQMEHKKRQLAMQVDLLTRDKKSMHAKQDYFSYKRYCQEIVEEHGTAEEKQKLSTLLENERHMLATNSPLIIQNALQKIWDLTTPIRWRTPQHVISMYYHYSSLDDAYTDKDKAEKLKVRGNEALGRANYDELRVVINQLYSLLPPREQEKANAIKGTGIG